MNRVDLDQLREPRGYPAVSLLCPLQRHRPGNSEDPVRLRHLAQEARRRLQHELGVRVSAGLVRRVEEGIDSIDLGRPSEAVALYATPSETRVLMLPFAVPERVVVDDAFETRDLARGLAQHPQYRVLVLAEKPTRLLESDGTTMTEVRSAVFPMFIEGARGDPIPSGGYAPHSSRSESQHEQFFRLVDHAFRAHTATNPLPLVIVGTKRDLAYFEQVTENTAWIVGRLFGNHELTPLDELTRLTRPIIHTHLAEQQAATVAELVDAIGAGRAVVGIKPVWQRGIEGRGRILLVEEDFEYPARVVDQRLEPAGAVDAPEILDDAVDALIDIVIESGGRVVFVGPGSLGTHGPIAMILRY
jgi:hypothetical protein